MSNNQITKAKSRLFVKPQTAFLSHCVMMTPVEEKSDIPTACTDGLNIYINPKFFGSLNYAEQEFIIMHEMLHILYLHCIRKGEREMQRWNVACDYAINAFLHDCGFTIPKGGLYDKKYAGELAEKIYDLLPAQLPPPDHQDLQPNGKHGKGDLERQVNYRLIQAKQNLEKTKLDWGNVPNDLKRYIDELLNPKIQWQVLLQRYLQDSNKSDYTWRKPNRKHFPHHYLPSQYSNALSRIDIAIDTSGSIGSKEFLHFISEVAHILKYFQPKEVGVLQFDTEIKSLDVVSNLNDLLNIQFKGGGGTNVKPVFKHYANSPAKVLIVLTDGYFDYENLQCTRPVLWTVFDNKDFKPNFGQVVEFSLDG